MKCKICGKEFPFTFSISEHAKESWCRAKENICGTCAINWILKEWNGKFK